MCKLCNHQMVKANLNHENYSLFCLQLPESELARLLSKHSASRPSTKHSTRSMTPNINVTSEDERSESPDFTLPKTPTGDIADRQFLSPGFRRQGSAGSPSSRRTPEEKIDKLIALYDGACSMKEYKDFVKPDEQEKDGKEDEGKVVASRVKSSGKLEPIVENAHDEEQISADEQDVMVENKPVSTEEQDDMVENEPVSAEEQDDMEEKEVSEENEVEPEAESLMEGKGRYSSASPTKTIDIVNALEADVELSVDHRSQMTSPVSSTTSSGH